MSRHFLKSKFFFSRIIKGKIFSTQKFEKKKKNEIKNCCFGQIHSNVLQKIYVIICELLEIFYLSSQISIRIMPIYRSDIPEIISQFVLGWGTFVLLGIENRLQRDAFFLFWYFRGIVLKNDAEVILGLQNNFFFF